MIIFLARILAGTFKQTQGIDKTNIRRITLTFLADSVHISFGKSFIRYKELSRLAIISKVSVSERPKVIGLFNSIGSAGFIIGPTIGGHIREYFPDRGFHICANITGIIFVLNFIIVAGKLTRSHIKP